MVKMPARTALVIAVALLVPTIGGHGPTSATAAQQATPPPGLPTHFAIGVSAAPDNTGLYGWMPNTGISWDYAYQYLSGGVNTGAGWETWNTSGQFPLYYAQGAAANHYIPVFSYYEMLQSNGSCGSCGEAQKDLSNLNNPGLMSSYFQNFALLMQRLGSGTYNGIAGFGQTAIVHIEPDLSGYANQAVLNVGGNACYGYCTGQGNNPAYLKAAVASSGYAPVAAYPNTYQGFNWALLHLRDLYAPNVRLAFHVSNWATGTDIGSDTSSSLNATALGQQAGSFAAQSGISGVPSGTSSYDLLFNDVSDRDAAYYKYVYNNPNAFWDRLNVTFPNFQRWETYVGAAGQASGRSLMVWQVPEGNQYFDTENNTNGHYQDNRAEYFFGHIAELVQAGIIGVLFGAGNGGSTVHFDGMNDGITNPASFCTGDGLSSGQICNNHTSTVSDDDGGYIRMQAQQYYASGGYPLNGNPPTATPTTQPTSTPTPGGPTATPTNTPATLNVTINSASVTPATVAPGGTANLSTTVLANQALSGAIVDFEVYNSAGTQVYQTYQSPVTFAANVPQTVHATWSVPSGQAAGSYQLKIGVFGANWTPMYAWDDTGATFAVGTASATNTPTGAPTKTPVPPTNTPTTAPTNTPQPPTATPTGATTPSFTFNKVTESASSIAPGATEHFTATIVSNQTVSNELVDFEVYNAAGAKVWQTWQSPVSFTASVARKFTAAWTIPSGQPTGTYTLEMGVFTASWNMQAWDSSAVTFTIAAKKSTRASASHLSGPGPHVITTRPRAHAHAAAAKHSKHSHRHHSARPARRH